jgi:hypothetical protein
LLAFGGVFFSGWLSLGLAVLPILFSGLYVILYSYLKYKQISNTKISENKIIEKRGL